MNPAEKKKKIGKILLEINSDYRQSKRILKASSAMIWPTFSKTFQHGTGRAALVLDEMTWAEKQEPNDAKMLGLPALMANW